MLKNSMTRNPGKCKRLIDAVRKLIYQQGFKVDIAFLITWQIKLSLNFVNERIVEKEDALEKSST